MENETHFSFFFCKSVLSNDVKATTFEINYAKLDVPVVTLSSQNHVKLLQQFKSGFKRRTNSNKYPSKVPNHVPNPYLNLLIDPSF